MAARYTTNRLTASFSPKRASQSTQAACARPRAKSQECTVNRHLAEGAGAKWLRSVSPTQLAARLAALAVPKERARSHLTFHKQSARRGGGRQQSRRIV